MRYKVLFEGWAFVVADNKKDAKHLFLHTNVYVRTHCIKIKQVRERKDV